VGATCVALTLVLSFSAPAIAGQFTVASCQSDHLKFSSTAFGDFSTRGMKTTRACDPDGPGLRGLITANVVQARSLPLGATSIATITAPTGTSFTRLRWAGSTMRTDCRYTLQVYADAPGAKAIPIASVRANQGCASKAGAAQSARYAARTINITGTTRIVQRVLCEGAPGHAACSARGANFIRTYQAGVGIADSQAPSARIIPDTPLGLGAWVSGTQPLNYDASDPVGVRSMQAVIGADAAGWQQRPCAFATLDGVYANPVPCPNGRGQITVDTQRQPEGTHPLVVLAQDTAGNIAGSAPVTARIDNTPPTRADVAVAGGEQWRNHNDFALAWVNGPESDRAPIASVIYKLCSAAAGGACRQTELKGAGITSLPIQVPGSGEWTVSLWRRDAAGNEDPNTSSVPIKLRLDSEPPQLAFAPSPVDDPTLVTAQVTDKVSGLAGGSIEISAAGSDTWRALDTHTDGSRLVARIDDATLPTGNYALRATAYDQAHNQASTTQREDGQQMAVALPLRIASLMRAGVPRSHTVRRVVRDNGKRRVLQHRVTTLKTSKNVAFGRRVKVAGHVTNRDGQGIPSADVQVSSRSESSPAQLVATLRTDATGTYHYIATASSSRVLRFDYRGTQHILPAQAEVRLKVPASSSIRVNHGHVLNGQSVMFSGSIRTLPIPAGGKLVELQVVLSGSWQTFRTASTDSAGHWKLPYGFARTRGVQRYRFRVRLAHEAGYPFADGVSRTIQVQVKGR
jgi:hypothetical protein